MNDDSLCFDEADSMEAEGGLDSYRSQGDGQSTT